MTVTLDQPLELPCGATLKNRLGKSAMSETLGTTDNRVTAKLTRLYRAWARGGTGLSVTGNVMIDRRALGEPCNVVLEDRRDMDRLKAWARAGRENGAHLWMQINHPGKQAPAALNRETVSPSAVPFSDPNLKRFFHVPRALTVAEIEDLVRRFGETAALAKEAGFSGVQIHGAHGYLVSQFLSPRHNRREAYFLSYAEQVRSRVKVPLMVTGGFRSREGMAAALEDGATDVIGLARPLVLDPAFSNRLLAGEDAVSAVAPIRTGIRAVDNAAMMEVSWYTLQLARIARGKAPLADAGGLSSLVKVAGLIGWRRLRMGRLRAS